MKDPVERREQMAKDPRQMGRLHGATMFLAELFLNTEVSLCFQNLLNTVEINSRQPL